MRNITIVVSLLFCCDVLFAQDSLQRTAPSTTNDNATPALSTNSSTPKPRRRKKLTAADSLRIIAQRDSLLRLQQQNSGNIPNNNPFNIGSTSNPAVANTQATDSATTTINNPIQPDNPFEILRGGEEIKNEQITTSDNTNKPSATSVLLKKETYSKNFLFWIFMVVLAFMALVVANLRSAIRNAFDALYSNNALRQIYKEPVIGWGGISYMLLYSLFWINAGIFIYLLSGYYGVKTPFSPFWTFMACIAIVGVIFLIKHLILYIIAVIFPIEKEIRTYNFIILTAGILLGLLLMPLNLFIAYSPTAISELAVFLGIGVVLFFYLVRSLRGLSVALPYIFTYRFHFLLYLCAVEIAPLLILIKLVSLNT